MARGKPPLPSFIIIGAQKSATRWLRYNLGRHPDIYTASEELAFFNTKRFKTLGEDWYRRQFKAWGGVPFVGEATPGYMMPRHDPDKVAKRMRQTVPDVRLIALLRNPIDRAQSAMLHHVRRERLPAGSHLVDLLRNPTADVNWLGLVSGGQYAGSLRAFQKRFGDQLQVYLHDDVRDDPAGLYARVLGHIGADTDFVPEDLDAVIFSNRELMGEQKELTFEERQELYEYFRDDIRHVQRIIDRDLGVWRPRRVRVRRERPVREPRRIVRMVFERSDPRARHEEALEWLSGVIGQLTPAQYDSPVADTGYTVGGALHEAVRSIRQLASALRREPAASSSPPDGDVDDLRAEFAVAADELRDVLARPGVLDGSVPIPTEEWPTNAHMYAREMFLMEVVYAWNAMVALDPDARVPEPLHAFARTTAEWRVRLEVPDSDDGSENPLWVRYKECIVATTAPAQTARSAVER
jgi:hypothetical protein